MDCYEWLKFASSLLVSVVAIIISAISLRQIRIHSSPKPFLKVEGVSTTKNSLCPLALVKNLGQGLAVNIQVHINVYNTKTHKIETILLEEQDVLLPDESVYYWYHGDLNRMLIQDISTVTISYESDSGFKRNVIWEVASRKDGDHKIRLILSK